MNRTWEIWKRCALTFPSFLKAMNIDWLNILRYCALRVSDPDPLQRLQKISVADRRNKNKVYTVVINGWLFLKVAILKRLLLYIIRKCLL